MQGGKRKTKEHRKQQNPGHKKRKQIKAFKQHPKQGISEKTQENRLNRQQRNRNKKEKQIFKNIFNLHFIL